MKIDCLEEEFWLNMTEQYPMLIQAIYLATLYIMSDSLKGETKGEKR